MSDRSVNYDRRIIIPNDESSSFKRYIEDFLCEHGLSGAVTNREIDLQFIAREFANAYMINTGKDVETMTKTELEDDRDVNDYLNYIKMQIEDVVCDWSVHPIYTWIHMRFYTNEIPYYFLNS